MGKRLVILILTLFISAEFPNAIYCVWGPAAAFGAGTARRNPLRDGFVLAGVDGKLTGPDSNDGRFFEFDSDISDDRGRIQAGAAIELLPSAALERLVANTRKHSEASYRLWGRVTKYKDNNFVFPIYFLPISEVGTPFSKKSQNGNTAKQLEPSNSQQQESKLTINEPNDVLTIPGEIVAKLATRKIVRPEQLLKGVELKQDSILADRTGFILKQDNGQLILTLDAVGWNIQQISLRLLPCDALERAQRRQSAELEPLRFKIAGIVTKYKGNYYLLLQRARRVYSHENFPN